MKKIICICSEFCFEEKRVWRSIWKKNSLFSANTATCVARASGRRTRSKDLGGAKAHLHCGMHWFNWNSGIASVQFSLINLANACWEINSGEKLFCVSELVMAKIS